MITTPRTGIRSAVRRGVSAVVLAGLVASCMAPATYPQGGYQQLGYRHGGDRQSGSQPEGYQQGGYQPGGYQQGGYQPSGDQQGGYQPGGDPQLGYQQRGEPQQGGYQQGGYPQQGGYQQRGYQPGPPQQRTYQQAPVNGRRGGSQPIDPYDAGASQASGLGMHVVYEKPTKKPEREAIRSFMQETKLFEQVSSAMNHMFVFPQAVTVVWTECGAVNAAWDGHDKILMCYELAEYLKKLFTKRVKDRKELRIAAMSSLMFVFLHEIAHGLIAMYKLPTVGREEDAADQLAGLILIMTGDGGAETAMVGAKFFRILATSGATGSLADEHSLDGQRYYNVMCMIYGSNPKRFASLVSDDQLPAARARRCPTEYSKISAAWTGLLRPHTRGR